MNGSARPRSGSGSALATVARTSSSLYSAGDSYHHGYSSSSGTERRGSPGGGGCGTGCFIAFWLLVLVGFMYMKIRGEHHFALMGREEPVALGHEAEHAEAFRDKLSSSVFVHKKSGRRFVIVAASNFAYRRLFVNFDCIMRSFGVQSVVLNALDQKMYDYAFEKGYTVFNVVGEKIARDTGLSGSFRRGSKQFNYLTVLKFVLPLKILQLGYDVIYVDLDVGFYRGFVDDLYSHQEDFVTMSDQNIWDKPANTLISSCLFLVRASPGSVSVLLRVLKTGFKAFGKTDEQTLWNSVLCKSGRVGKETCLISEEESELYVRVLDRDKYTPASEFRSTAPIAVHFNRLEGRQQKWRQLWEGKSWLLTMNGTCIPKRGKHTILQVSVEESVPEEGIESAAAIAAKAKEEEERKAKLEATKPAPVEPKKKIISSNTDDQPVIVGKPPEDDPEPQAIAPLESNRSDTHPKPNSNTNSSQKNQVEDKKSEKDTSPTSKQGSTGKPGDDGELAFFQPPKADKNE